MAGAAAAAADPASPVAAGVASGEDAGMEKERARAEAAAAAVAAVRGAVDEIRTLNAQEASEDAMRAAKGRLAAAIRAATAAGVSQEELLQATTPPSPPAEEEAVQVGDRVEVFGLESESGKLLNGKVGTVLQYLEEKGRFQIELGPGSIISVRPANLRRAAGQEAAGAPEQGAAAADGRAAEEKDSSAPIATGDRVEVFGLESESGSKLNGRVGIVREFVEDKGRFKVELGPEEVVSVKPANLRRLPPAAGDADDAKEQRSGGSSSSSSSPSERPSSRKRSRKEDRKPQALSPEETLERLLQGRSSRKRSKKDRPSKDDVDPEDRAAEMARAAGAVAAAAAAAAAAAVARAMEPLKPGDRVEVFGLQSEAGRPLNGRTGLITRWVEEKGRFQVELGMSNPQSLKPENLRLASFVGTGSGGGGFFDNNYTGSTAGYTLL